VFAWWAIVQGLPLAAEAIARQIPVRADAVIGEHALAAIDGRVCHPSRLSTQMQERLQRDFARLVAGLDDGHRYRLHLRYCPGLGPNAFALPGGPIVLTDQLADFGHDFSEMTAVLAHEVGHVRLRHGLRTLLQGAGLAALISTLAGDAAAITSIAVTVPTVILQSGYSGSSKTTRIHSRLRGSSRLESRRAHSPISSSASTRRGRARARGPHATIFRRIH
jgi:predicted Zn-dependent protease